MKLSEVWKRIEELKTLDKRVKDIERSIRNLKTVSRHTEEIIDLSSGQAMIDLESAMKAEFAGRRAKALQKQKMKLLVKRQDLILDLEKDYQRLKRKYAKELLTMKLYFKKFIRELQKLQTLWRCMNEDGDRVRNIHRTLWELGNLLGKSETIETLPPFHRWADEMRRSFTRLENYEREVERNAAK